MTHDERQHVEQTVRRFACEFWNRLRWQAGQFIPGADSQLPMDIMPENVLERGIEAQEWLTMALYGAGLQENDPAYIYEICQGMAEWLFATIPDQAHYTIPDAWAESEMGALWWAAMIRVEGDELITMAEAAVLAEVPLSTLQARLDRGQLRAFVDPTAPARQGRRLVRRGDVVVQSE